MNEWTNISFSHIHTRARTHVHTRGQRERENCTTNMMKEQNREEKRGTYLYDKIINFKHESAFETCAELNQQ